MLAAVERALPADAAVMAAAVADWRAAEPAGAKIKKGAGTPALKLVENPDILATIGRRRSRRPALVVGFAAETDDLVDNARAKLKSKGANWILANDVSPRSGIMGGEENMVHLITAADKTAKAEYWPRLPKTEVARRLVDRIAQALGRQQP